MKRQAIFLFLPIFLVFFVWGLQVGNNLEEKIPIDSANQRLDLEKNINSLPNGQKSIFIFIVSQLDTQNPELIGVWLMSYMSTEPYATALAIYPPPFQNENAIDNRMANTFQLKKVKGIPQLDDKFLATLNETNIWYSGYILIDIDGLTEAFKLSGGEDDLANEPSGEDIINQISKTNEPSFSPLIYQTLLLQQLCNKFTLVDSFTELKLLRDLFPRHISSNLDPDVLLGDWQQFINSRNGSFCVFPQKDVLVQITK